MKLRLALRFAAMLLIGLPAGIAMPRPSLAQPVKIAAVVNDEVVSVLDVIARLKLVVVATGQANITPDAQEKLAPQILRMLIDERLQMQEAKAKSITVPTEDLNAAYHEIETNNKMPDGMLDKVLANAGIPRDTLIAQLRARLAWQRVVQTRLRGSLTVSEEEIDEELAEIRGNVGKPEYLLAELFLAVDNPDHEEDIRRTAGRLMEQLRAGEPFAALARQFSDSATANSGGDLGWVHGGQLDPALDQAVATMQPSQVAGPIRTATGLHLILLREKRLATGPDPAQSSVTLRQLVISEAAAGGAEAAGRLASRAATEVTNGCPDLDRFARDNKLPAPNDMGKLKLTDLAQQIQAAVMTAPVGKARPGPATPQGPTVLMVCDRDEVGGDLPDREDIRRRLIGDRFDVAARRYMRDLRQSAFIEIRTS